MFQPIRLKAIVMVEMKTYNVTWTDSMRVARFECGTQMLH